MRSSVTKVPAAYQVNAGVGHRVDAGRHAPDGAGLLANIAQTERYFVGSIDGVLRPWLSFCRHVVLCLPPERNLTNCA